MTPEEGKKEAERLSEMIKNSKLLTELDMQWFDYMYNVSPVVNSCLDLYRIKHEVTLEEALLKMVVELGKGHSELQDAYWKLKLASDEYKKKHEDDGKTN
jgi:hypothetical protein